MIARILYYSFVLQHAIVITLLHILLPFLKKRRKGEGIAALPYYPKDWPGGKDRIAAWKPLFEKEGIRYDLFPCWTNENITAFFEAERKESHLERYKIYYRIYFSRIKTLFKLKNYEAVWVQRAYTPLFPFKHAYYEKLLRRIHDNIVYDFYDADYESNETLVFETVRAGDKITVASEFLRSKLEPYNENIDFLRYSIDTAGFKPHKRIDQNTIKIGWMGSPGNAMQLTLIKEQLQKIEMDFPNVVFSFTCRELPELGLNRFLVQKWGDEGFDYYEWLANLDIGIVPFIEQTDRVKAKISMKNLEFMVAGIPQVSSPYVHSDKLENGTSCLISQPEEWYDNLRKLIEDSTLRTLFSEKSTQIYLDYHSYEVVYPRLKKILLGKV